MSRKFLSTAFLAALALPLINCGGSPHAADEVYYLVAVNVKLPYWQTAAAGFAQAGKQLQVKYEMVGPDTYDPKGEVEEFRRTVAKKPKGILVSPADPKLMKPEIDAAIAQGIPVLTIDSDSPASQRLLFIGTNNFEAGRMGAEVAVKRLGGKGNVVVYTMPEQANLQERLQGYRTVFANSPGIKIETVDIKGDPRLAFDRTMDIVEKNQKVDGFVCLEASACSEVAEVLSRKNVKDKVVIAMDTDQRTLEWIQKGLIAATVGQKPWTMGFYGLNMLDDLHHHAPANLAQNWSQNTMAPFPVFADTGAMLVDKTNVDSVMQQAAASKK